MAASWCITGSMLKGEKFGQSWMLRNRNVAMTYRDYLKSQEWQLVSKQAKKRAGHRCQLCNASGELHTHHRTYDRLGDELDSDVIVLCSACHAHFHDKLKSITDQWIERVRDQRSMFHALVIAQSDEIHIDSSGDVWLRFGSSASEHVLSSFDGKEICGRTIRIAVTLNETEGLSTSVVDGVESIHLKAK